MKIFSITCRNFGVYKDESFRCFFYFIHQTEHQFKTSRSQFKLPIFQSPNQIIQSSIIYLNVTNNNIKMSAPRNNSVASTSTIGSIRSFARVNHEAVNDAYRSFYGIPQPSASSEKKGSVDSSASKGSRWSSIKAAAKDFHRDVNASVNNLYAPTYSGKAAF
jgi:hypothetical protein